MNAPWRLCVLTIVVSGCAAPSVPFPARGPEPAAAEFVDVPDAPPPPRPEIIRQTPDAKAVWVDGQWERVDDKWRWARGSWVIPPAGARFTGFRVRRARDGTLHFAGARWVDATGQTIDVEKLRASAP